MLQLIRLHKQLLCFFNGGIFFVDDDDYVLLVIKFLLKHEMR